MKNQTYKIHASLGSMQLTKKMPVKASGAADAAQAWLNHKANRDFSQYTLIKPGRHEGYNHEDDTTLKVFRFTALAPFNLNAIIIWVNETL